MTDIIHEYLTADRECLLALLSALLSAETIPSPAAQVLEQYLGLGWARDYASARSPQEREELIVRRLRLHQPIRRARPGSVAPCTEVVR
jgi:hypothetical protein